MSGSDELISIPDVDEMDKTTVHMITTHTPKLLDDRITDVLLILPYHGVIPLLCVFGIVTNIFNIIVFTKQGFGDSINISFLGLAVSDLGILMATLWVVTSFSPLMQYSDLPIEFDDIGYLTAGWPRVFFTRITGWITAFITFERCLCIAMPLKVNMIITPKRIRIIIVLIFLVQAGSVIPSYLTSWLEWKFSPERNTTVLALTFSEYRDEIDSLLFIVLGMVLPMLAFVTVVICTVILSVKLHNMAIWREKSVKKTATNINKEKKTVRLVSLISTVFIVCFTPNVVMFFGMSYEPELTLDGAYYNLFKVLIAVCMVFESVNSSINFFFYMKMSSKFRTTFKVLFHKPSGTQNHKT